MMQYFKKSLFTSLVFLFFATQGFSQDSVHVFWNGIAKKAGAGVYLVTVKGTLQPGWHIYHPDAAQEIAGITAVIDDSAFVLSPAQILSTGKKIIDPVFDKKELTVSADSISFTQQLTIKGDIPANVQLELAYYVGRGETFLPEESKLQLILEGGIASTGSKRILIPTIDINHPLADCGVSNASAGPDTKSKGLLGIFFLGFLGGLVALLLPCLFPMIPLTVSFFTKRATSRKAGIRNAFLYGFFIFLIYVLISVPFHFISSLKPEILNNISTNVYLNCFFFLIFVVFAVSFFGYFEITLPASLSSKADSKAGSGNIGGIFFMALTLALVSFSCTGPVLGSLLAGSLSGDGGAMRLTFGMGGFGLALALPFALFALFPNWLNSLPKSGGWLNSVKVVLGFIELALAFKFLSNADLVMHWGLLKREIFIGIWIIIGACLSLYLFGKIRFPHDSPLKKLSKLRLSLAILTALFTIYLVPGLTNTKWANLSLISGFPPPLYYSIYKSGEDCVLDLNCTRDYEQGLKMAREQNKPILLDFTGYACVNCRRMEENVWSKPDVYQLMKDKFIVISLYVDDKKRLPSADQFTYTTRDGSTKEIKTVGDKWSTFETENFANNAQPWYAILNTEEQLLNHPVGYVPSHVEYLQWLQCGVDAFYKK